MPLRTYSGMMRRETFEERFQYLSLSGRVGEPTFGTERWINQEFYASTEWRRVRQFVRARDLGCDLAVEGREIPGKIFVHHMNPMVVDDIVHANEDILNPEYLICVSHLTHNAIHYGDERQLPQPLVERRPGDTLPWATSRSFR